ncbi:MAG: UDP-2,3-diacylglucosamine diphosphatase [Verrucomicrobia bacterium]|nr:UDP-2,3-diacylglucosamine diphosphatase [Verrucomicrobiota bacterium]
MKTPDKRHDFHTIFLSDIHLGTRDSKCEEVIAFLKATTCRKLVLNGDIVDGWALRSGGRWLPIHTKFIRTVLKKMEKQGTEVIYLRGNHDDILERFLPVCFGNLRIVDEYVHETPRGEYLVVHGDGFDRVTTSHRWVAIAGAKGYELLLGINRLYNRWRAFRGKEYFSLSKTIKARVKSAVSFVDRYEDQLKELAAVRGCRGIICGHIHTPADKQLDNGVHYLNSGDWVESLTAIVEQHPGDFELIHYSDFLQRGDLDGAIRQRENDFVEIEEGEKVRRTALLPA